MSGGGGGKLGGSGTGGIGGGNGVTSSFSCENSCIILSSLSSAVMASRKRINGV